MARLTRTWLVGNTNTLLDRSDFCYPVEHCDVEGLYEGVLRLEETARPFIERLHRAKAVMRSSGQVASIFGDETPSMPLHEVAASLAGGIIASSNPPMSAGRAIDVYEQILVELVARAEANGAPI